MLFLLPRRRQTGGTLAAAGVLLLALAGPAPARPLPPDETPPTPVGRGGTLPTPYTLGALPNTLADPADLGQHSWRDHDSETLGILYACRAGFLDLVHIRNAADWTLHLQARLQRALLRGEPALEVEGADRGVRLHIAFPTPLAPEEREALAPALALQLARRYAFILLDWHEVTTWYGHGVLPFVSERPSAFSVDDTASHLVGLDLAERALADPQRALLPALTAQLGPLLQELGVQPRAQTTLAMVQVRGLWWNPHRSWPANNVITRRQVDSGHPEQTFTAWQVPGLAAPGHAGDPGGQLRPGQPAAAHRPAARARGPAGRAGRGAPAHARGTRPARRSTRLSVAPAPSTPPPPLLPKDPTPCPRPNPPC
jgi:hypothetical protein